MEGVKRQQHKYTDQRHVMPTLSQQPAETWATNTRRSNGERYTPTRATCSPILNQREKKNPRCRPSCVSPNTHPTTASRPHDSVSLCLCSVDARLCAVESFPLLSTLLTQPSTTHTHTHIHAHSTSTNPQRLSAPTAAPAEKIRSSRAFPRCRGSPQRPARGDS